MSTWNQLTITNLAGDPIESLTELEELLEEHGWEVDCYDGDSLDYRSEQVEPYRKGPDGEYIPPVYKQMTTEVYASWHSKYSCDVDFAAVSKALGPQLQVDHSEEWDDDEPGGNSTTWVDGEVDLVKSTHTTWISDAVRPDRALLEPVFFSEAELREALDGGGFDPGVRFLILPPEPLTPSPL